MPAKFNYTITTFCSKSASKDETIPYNVWANDTKLREQIFAEQQSKYDQALSKLSQTTFIISALSFMDACNIANSLLSKELGCTVEELHKIHRVAVYPRFISDSRSRRILRRRSLSERDNNSDYVGIALPYLRAKSHRIDFDTHYMNIADCCDGKSYSEFLTAYNNY
jgi:hypothetical protein